MLAMSRSWVLAGWTSTAGGSVSGSVRFEKGALAPPSGPGLGVRLDREALANLHKQYVDCGIRKRDDAKEMRKYRPDWKSDRPRF